MRCAAARRTAAPRRAPALTASLLLALLAMAAAAAAAARGGKPSAAARAEGVRKVRPPLDGAVRARRVPAWPLTPARAPARPPGTGAAGGAAALVEGRAARARGAATAHAPLSALRGGVARGVPLAAGARRRHRCGRPGDPRGLRPCRYGVDHCPCWLARGWERRGGGLRCQSVHTPAAGGMGPAVGKVSILRARRCQNARNEGGRELTLEHGLRPWSVGPVTSWL